MVVVLLLMVGPVCLAGCVAQGIQTLAADFPQFLKHLNQRILLIFKVFNSGTDFLIQQLQLFCLLNVGGVQVEKLTDICQ